MIDLTGVPALTLKNPWAHLVAHCGKNVENRTWKPPESLTRVLIHAGKYWDNSAAVDTMRRLGVAATTPIVISAIVAVADVAYVCNTSRWTDEVCCGCGEWAQPGQCHWALTDVQALPVPVPCDGALRLWRPAPPVVAQVEEQLGAVA